MRRYVPKDEVDDVFDIETLIPYRTIARINQNSANPTRAEINQVCGSVMQVAFKYEGLELKYKKVHLERKALEGQLRITDHFIERMKVERNKFESIDRIAEAGKHNAELQKALDKLQVEHDDKVSRLEKAEARIKEMENAKDEKMKGDLMEVLGQVAEDMICPITLESLVCTEKIEVASDGHSYDKEALEKWLGKSQKSPMTGAPMERHTIPNRTLMSLMRQIREMLQKSGKEANSP